MTWAGGRRAIAGIRGPGAPIFDDDPHGPGRFGFDEWVSVSNFNDVDPLMSRAGKFEQFKGDSSEIAVAEAVKFLEQHKAGGKPTFAVVWYGTPHSPFKALDADKGLSRLASTRISTALRCAGRDTVRHVSASRFISGHAPRGV